MFLFIVKRLSCLYLKSTEILTSNIRMAPRACLAHSSDLAKPTKDLIGPLEDHHYALESAKNEAMSSYFVKIIAKVWPKVSK